jgi:hypothetical protein
LKYTDQSGEELVSAILIGAGVALAAYLTTSIVSGTAITLRGAIIATFVGAISGAVTCGIGTWTAHIQTFALKATTQAVAHGLFQGLVSGVQGGGFWAGAAAGALSSIASSLYQGVGYDNAGWHGLGGCGATNTTGMIIFGTVMGGAGAAITGGNFWAGAAAGYIVSSLNHAMKHERSMLSRFKKTGGKYVVDPFAKPDLSEAGLTNMHDGVIGLYNAFVVGGHPLVTYDAEGVEEYATTSKGHVYINSGLLQDKNNLFYAGVLFHEYRHAYQFIAAYMGFNSRVEYWQSLYGMGTYSAATGQTYGGYLAAMERDAYSYQYRMGDANSYVLSQYNKFHEQISYKPFKY